MTSMPAVALLATILLSASLHAVSILPSVGCQCCGTHSEPFHPKYIKEMKIIWSGPHCDHMENIIKLDNEFYRSGPNYIWTEAKWVQKVVQIILERAGEKLS